MIITTINVELTDRCQKNCWCCGRRKTERDNPDIVKTYGEMDIELVIKIASQLPDKVFVHLHNNGEPLLYPDFGYAVSLFWRQFTHITTNGKLLIKKFKELRNLNTIAISVIQNDPEADEQYAIIEEYMSKKNRPYTVIRLNGKVDDARYLKFGVPIARRNLHNPMGSFDYTASPTIPETGICWDFLHHPAINKNGDVSICVRYDPNRLGVLGNIKEQSLDKIFNNPLRNLWERKHFTGKRNEVPLCETCEYWGIPQGGKCI